MHLASIPYAAFDPVAFSLGPVTVRWYGLAYLSTFIICAVVARWLIKRWDLALTDDDLLTFLLAAVIGVIVGGRLGYVIFYGDGYFFSHPGEALAIWNGGMSFHGGLAGIMIAGVIAARITKMPLLTLWDLGAAGAPSGFLLGRLANYVNGELWGRVTDAPWGMVFPGAGALPRHPSQLYEAGLEGALLWAIVLVLATRMPPRPRGELVGWELTLYAVFRIFIEFFREPDVQLGYLAGGWLTMGMLLSLPVLAGGITLIVTSRRRDLPQAGRQHAV